MKFESMNDNNHTFRQKYLPISLVLVSTDPTSLTRRYDDITSSQISPKTSVWIINAIKSMTRFYIKGSKLFGVLGRFKFFQRNQILNNDFIFNNHARMSSEQICLLFN